MGNFSRKPTQIAYDLLCEFASQTSASPHPSKAFNKDSRKSSRFTIENGGVLPFGWTKLVKFVPFLKVFEIPKNFFQKVLWRVKGRALAHPPRIPSHR